MAYVVLPDVEQELVTFLAAHASLTALHGGRVSTELATALTCLQVTGLGGAQPWPWQGVPEFQIAAWGGTKGEASTLARTVVAALFDLVGAAVTGGRVVGVSITLGPLWQPDDQTARPRYLVHAALTAYP